MCLSAYIPRVTIFPSLLSICKSVCLSICLYVCLSVCLSIYRYVYLSVYMSICLSVSLSICKSVCLPVSHLPQGNVRMEHCTGQRPLPTARQDEIQDGGTSYCACALSDCEHNELGRKQGTYTNYASTL